MTMKNAFCNAQVALITPLVLTVLLAGCAAPGVKGPEAPIASKTAPEAVKDVPAAPAADPKEQETLAAIEDFLARTQKYSDAKPLTFSPTPATTNKPTTEKTPVAEPVVPPQPTRRAEGTANVQMTLGDSQPPPHLPAIPAVQRVVIRTSDRSSDSNPVPAALTASNVPMLAVGHEGRDARQTVLSELKSEAETSKSLDSQWRLRLAQLAIGDEIDAREPVPSLPTDTGELIAGLVDTAIAVRTLADDRAEPGYEAVQAADRLREHLANLADPYVSTIALCSKVLTFGVYEELDSDDLLSGRSIQMIVYSEIDNLKSEKTDDGLFESRLATRIEVFTKDGESVWTKEEPEIVDTCRNRRHDFFIAERITIPPTLPAGEYVLKVTVLDQLASKTSESTHPFALHSPVSIARTP